MGYADDHVLLSPTIKGLMLSVDLITKEANNLNLKFNPGKSKFIKFYTNNFSSQSFVYNNINYNFEKEVIYLGNILTHDLSDTKTVENIRNRIIWNSNSINQALSTVHPNIVCKVLKSKCLNLYGSECIFLNRSSVIKRIETAWNKSLRRCFKLHNHSHVNLLCNLSDVNRLSHVIFTRSLKFVSSLRFCNPVTNFLCMRFDNDCNSFIGNNRWTAYNYLTTYDHSNDINPHTSSVKELIDCLFNVSVISGFTKRDIEFMLNFISAL